MRIRKEIQDLLVNYSKDHRVPESLRKHHANVKDIEFFPKEENGKINEDKVAAIIYNKETLDHKLYTLIEESRIGGVLRAYELDLLLCRRAINSAKVYTLGDKTIYV